MNKSKPKPKWNIFKRVNKVESGLSRLKDYLEMEIGSSHIKERANTEKEYEQNERIAYLENSVDAIIGHVNKPKEVDKEPKRTYKEDRYIIADAETLSKGDTQVSHISLISENSPTDTIKITTEGNYMYEIQEHIRQRKELRIEVNIEHQEEVTKHE